MTIYNKEEIEMSFNDLKAHKKTSRIIASHSTNRQDIREFALEGVDFSDIKNILDIGCGFGFFTLGLMGKIQKGTHVVGIDILDIYQQPFLATCRKIGACGEFHHFDANELASYPPHSFDLVLSSFSLYFFPNTIRYIPQLLSRNGIFIAITHSEDTLSELIRHIPTALAQIGIRAPETLNIQKLFQKFSPGNGRKILTPLFDRVEMKNFNNRLRFNQTNIHEIKPYLHMKKYLLLKEALHKKPGSMDEALGYLFSSLIKEVEKNKMLELNKNDAVFICRCPKTPQKKTTKPPPKKYCVSCGTLLVKKLVEDKKRGVCPRCSYIAYENPLPVVSAVVVNERREVLLVKRARQPMKGMWCLPSGFAEADENIEEAVLRELMEEAGIRGRIKRLLDAESTYNYFYGNLVMMSFEIVKARGRPKAGDDAEGVKFFPIFDLPPLAFPSNERAIQKYKELYEETWAIQESFSWATAEKSNVQKHISDLLVKSVERNTGKILKSWLKTVSASDQTPTYHNFPPAKLNKRAGVVLKHLGEWLSEPEDSTKLDSFYSNLGSERKKEGFDISEVLFSFRLLRNEIITHAQSLTHSQSVLDIYRITEFQMRIIGFFDRAIFYAVRGYVS